MFDLALRPAGRIPWKRIGAVASRILPPVLMAAAAYVLWRELREVSLSEMMDHASQWGPWRISGALLLAAIAYGYLMANEVLTFSWLRTRMTPFQIAPVSFMAYAFGNSVGFNLLVATAVRVRAYRKHRVHLSTIVAAGAWNSQMFWGGLAALAGTSMLATGDGLWRAAGGLLLLLPIALIAGCALCKKSVKLFGRSWRLPPARLALLQLVNAIGINLALAGVFFLLVTLPPSQFLEFAGAYSASLGVGLLSGAPGGLGVFESAMLTLTPDFDRPALAAAFIGYRLAYFILPLTIAGLMLLIRERPWAPKD